MMNGSETDKCQLKISQQKRQLLVCQISWVSSKDTSLLSSSCYSGQTLPFGGILKNKPKPVTQKRFEYLYDLHVLLLSCLLFPYILVIRFIRYASVRCPFCAVLVRWMYVDIRSVLYISVFCTLNIRCVSVLHSLRVRFIWSVHQRTPKG